MAHEGPITINEIRESVRFMRRRLEEGQGDVTSAMCRLSLQMSEKLLLYIDELEDTLRDIHKNYDCDVDGHRTYPDSPTGCRCCKAQSVLENEGITYYDFRSEWKREE